MLDSPHANPLFAAKVSRKHALQYLHISAGPRKSATGLPRVRPGSAPHCSTSLGLIIVKEAAFSLAHFDQPGVIRAVEPIVNSGMSLKHAPGILARVLGAC